MATPSRTSGAVASRPKGQPTSVRYCGLRMRVGKLQRPTLEHRPADKTVGVHRDNIRGVELVARDVASRPAAQPFALDDA